MSLELEELKQIKEKIDEFIIGAKAKGDNFTQSEMKKLWSDFKFLLKTGNPKVITEFVDFLRSNKK